MDFTLQIMVDKATNRPLHRVTPATILLAIAIVFAKGDKNRDRQRSRQPKILSNGSQLTTLLRLGQGLAMSER